MNQQKCCGALVISIFLLTGFLTGQVNAGIVPGDFDNDCDVDSVDFGHLMPQPSRP